MHYSSTDDVKSLGTILGIWAHPDDEVFTMGGLLAAAVQNGQTIVMVTATRGEGGVQDEARWPAKKLGAIREQELHDAYKILGISHHHWLDYTDGGCEAADETQAVQRLVSLIETYKPDSIFTFGPDGLTGHPDHQTVSHWATLAHDKANSQARIFHAVQTTDQYAKSQALDNALNFFYNTPKPPTRDESETAICLHLDENQYDLKKRALMAMPSQYQIMFERFDEQAVRDCFDVEAFIMA